jgi:glucose/arabinose dehydrogenase
MRPSIVAAAVAAVALAASTAVGVIVESPAVAASGLRVTTVVGGLNHPWDIAFAHDGAMFVTERGGRLSVRLADGTVRPLTTDLSSDLWVSGETGLMGVEVDPDFATNRRVYTCQGTSDNNFTVQVVAWTVDAGYTSATRVNDPLVGGIDGRSGRHGGCQLRIDGNGALWIGTGDAAFGANPQSLSSLAGKVLRVDRFTGAGLAGNPFFGLGGDRARIYSWGHRNVQGLAVHPASGQMWSVEHGPDRDDEINRLVAGGNYGWDPVPGYNESVPMTDLAKFPGAISAAWSSGVPTVATSGAAFLRGTGWGTWEGGLAVSALRDSRLRVMFFDDNGRFAGSLIPPELDRTHGRLRGAEIGPGGLLYVTTDNGGSTDRVLAVAPPETGFGLGVATAAPAPDIATRASDDRVSVRSSAGAWSSIGGLTTSDPDAASWGDRLDIVVRGIDGAVWHRTRVSGAWSGWTSLGGFVTSGPSVVATGLGQLDVFARGVDGELWTRSLANGTWSGWSSLGGLLTSDPDAAARGYGEIDVFARGTDGALWMRRATAGAWLPWQWIGGQLTSGPTATTLGPGRVDVFVRGLDDAVYQIAWFFGGGWTRWYLGVGLLTSAPEAVWRDGGRLDLLMRGIDGSLYQMIWNGSVWTAPFRPG